MRTWSFTALQDECYKLLGKKATAEFSYVAPKEKKGEIEKARFWRERGPDAVRLGQIR